MEKVLLVKNGDLSEVNRYLQNGARVKLIHDVPKNVSPYDERETGSYSENGTSSGDAYFVVKFN